MPSFVGGDKKVFLLLKLGLTPLAALGFPEDSSTRPDGTSVTLSCTRLPMP